MANEYLAIAYDEIDAKKAQRLRDCAQYIKFRVYANGDKRLETMSSCRVRLCPLCAWRRSLKVFYNTKQVVDYVAQERGYSYILLTLTIRNCNGEDLPDTINDLMSAWDRLAKTAPFKGAVKGWYRGLEVTHNVATTSKDYNTFHPHFHCLLAVNPSYFTSRDYLSQKKWSELWQNCLRVPYIPVVDVRKVDGCTGSAVAEVAKYAVKDADYILADDWDLTVETVRVLDGALANRRLVAYGGCLRDAHRLLKLDDEMDGSLVDVGDDDCKHSPDEPFTIETYYWYTGYRQYGRLPDGSGVFV